MLSPRERSDAVVEGQDPAAVAQVKAGWLAAYDAVLARLCPPDGAMHGAIRYYPARWHESRSPIAMYQGHPDFDDGVMVFTTPNADFPHLIYGSHAARVGAAAHEKFGHPADFARMREEGRDSAAGTWAEWPAREQRTNLRVALAFPREYPAAILATVASFGLRFGLPHLADRELLPLAMLEIVAGAGAPRYGDLLAFYRRLDRDSGGRARAWYPYLTYGLTNSLAGAAERMRTTELRAALIGWLEQAGAAPPVFDDSRFLPGGSLEDCTAAIDRRWVRLPAACVELAAAQAEQRERAADETRDEVRWVYDVWSDVLGSLEAMAAAPEDNESDGAAGERSNP